MEQGTSYSGIEGDIFLGDLQVGSVGEWRLKDDGVVLHFVATQYFLNKFWLEKLDHSRPFTLRLDLAGATLTFRGKLASRNVKLGEPVKGRLYLRSFESLKLE